MPRSFSPIVVLFLLAGLMSGCATVGQKEFKTLKGQVYRNRSGVNELRQEQKAVRRPQANLTAEVESLRQDIAVLRGQVEETQFNLRRTPNAQELRRSLAASHAKLEERLARMENYLGLKKGGKPPTGPSPQVKRPAAQTTRGPKRIYALGKDLYKKKSYSAARGRFEKITKKYPKNRFASSAQYMTGQTYYAQRKYEEAILAYQQVMKRYPRSSLVPAAMLKQAMAFRAIGDKRTAKIVLRKLTKKYPKSSQAKTAKKMLRKLN